MGFYGNITNVSRTQFQFDKIYPNRRNMDRDCLKDGIFLGRYVLVEYDQDNHLDTFLQVQMLSGVAYTDLSEIPDAVTMLTWSSLKEGEIVYTVSIEAKKERYKYYARLEKPINANDNDPARFKEITSSAEENYVINYNIDLSEYKSSRGYDSTVWQKVYTEQSERTEKYVMIAELNTVVPTFDVVPDAPTMSPIVPHFDTQSTDVYYKLHWQAPWGFRIAKADTTTTTEGLSDATTSWVKEKYDPDTNTSELQYYFPAENTWRVLEEGELIPTFNSAIYYNKAGFEENVPSYKEESQDYIKILPTGMSGEKYNTHDGSLDMTEQYDTQEFIINLPSIGNMMSKAWDIIHGPNRDDARTDENGSLQGRLDSFKDMAADEIPVKRGSDGTIIGATINGGKTSNEDLTGKNDDKWIETMVNGNIESVTIKHTFNPVTNTSSISDINNNGDTIDLYTPKVDDMGHVVGNNVETVTLPYGFKTIKTNGRSTEVSENATGTPAAADVVADNTQDELTINSGNKWIRIDTDVNADSLTIRHDVHNTSSDEATTNWTQTEANTTIPTVTYAYDEAGHYVSHHTENYQLPFGYGKIKGDSGNTAATATYDELTFTSDEWLTATVSKDTVTYSHDYPKKVDDTTSNSDVNGNGDTIVLETLIRDEKGHVTHVNQNTVTLPYGYKTFKDSETTPGQSIANSTQDIMTLQGDTWVKPTVSNDLIKIEHIGPVTATHTSKTNVTPKFGETFTIEDHYYDNKGHIYTTETHTVAIPKGSLTDNNANGADVITQLTFTDSTGALGTTRTNISNLKLTDYSKKTDNSDIAATDALGDALSKLQTQIHDAETTINNLDYSETANNTQIITQITQVDGKITNVVRAAAGTLTLGSGYSVATKGEAINSNDSLNSAFGKMEKSLSEEKARAEQQEKEINNRIDNLIGGENLNAAFDTLKEVADWLDTNDSNADKVIDSIAILNGTMETKGSVAHSIKQAIDSEVNDRNSAITTAINDLDVSDAAIEGQYVSAVNEVDGKIQVSRTSLPVYTLASGDSVGTIKFNNTNIAVNGLKSAAYREEVYFVSKTQYDLDMSTKDAQINGLNAEAKRLTNENIALMETVKQLSERLTALENANNPTE